MDMINIEKLKEFVIEYCRLDIDMDGYEYDSIDNYIYASIEYIDNATGISIHPKLGRYRRLYMLAVAMLVSHWYENRAITTVENNASLKQSLTYIFLQLKNCGYGEY